MIAKGKAVSHGRTVIEYVLREKKLGSFVEKNLLTSETADEILQEMKWTQAYNSRCKNKFLRFEIGIAPDDKDKLTKLQLRAIVMNFAKKMGLEKHQWLAVTHKDTDNLHIRRVVRGHQKFLTPYLQRFFLNQVVGRPGNDPDIAGRFFRLVQHDV